MKSRSSQVPAPVRVSARKAGIAAPLQALNLYKAKAVTVFSPDKNHNLVKVKIEPEDTYPLVAASAAIAAPSKRRAGSVIPSAATKRAKTNSSSGVAPSRLPSLTSGFITKKRGRPPAGAGTAAATVAGKQSKRGRPPASKKAAKQLIAAAAGWSTDSNDDNDDDGNEEEEAEGEQEEEEEEVEDDDDMPLVQPISPPRTTKKAPKRGAPRAKSPPRVVNVLNASFSSATSGQRKRTISFRAALDERATANNPQLSASKKKKLVTLLEDLCEHATTMTTVNYKTVIDSVKTASEIIDDGELIVGGSAAQQERQQKQEKAEWAKQKMTLNKSLAASHKQAAQLRADNNKLQAELQKFKRQLQQYEETANEGASSSSSSAVVAVATTSGRSGRGRRGRGAAAAAPTRDPTLAHHLLIPPQMQQPRYDLQALPAGSAIGHTTMAGRADDLISGLGGMAAGNSMASVAVTAATIPDMDRDGNLVQRTVRTRIERIAVEDGMDISELRRLGFEVVPGEAGEEGEDDEEPDINEQPARIVEIVDEDDDEQEEEGDEEQEQMDDDDGEMVSDIDEDDDEEVGGPYVEEAE